MNIKSIVATMSALLLSTNATGALVSYDGYASDDVSGLDWLDLSITAGRSMNHALSLNNGWRLATNTEVENLWYSNFQSYSYTSFKPYISTSFGSTLYNEANAFSQALGVTYTSGSGGKTTLGWYADETGDIQTMGTIVYSDRAIAYSHEYLVCGDPSCYSTNSAAGNIGVYMVRNPSVVPIPSAAWLFGSGLLGLAGLARCKKTG